MSGRDDRGRPEIAVLLAAGLVLAATLPIVHEPRAAAVADGPVPGYTGGFGEPTCTTCHFDAPAEPADDALTIEGVPGTFEPGTRYELAVVLRDPRLERAGFQLAARYADGPEQGRQAGGLSALGERAEVVTHGEPPVLYARQTREGARPEAPGSARWTLAWTAPEEPSGAVVFHAAANAANYDDSELGDVVHTGSVESRSSPR